MMYLDDEKYLELRLKCAKKMLCAACRCIEETTHERTDVHLDEIFEAANETARTIILQGADIWPEYTREATLK